MDNNWTALRACMMVQQKNICAMCGEVLEDNEFTLHHIKPRAEGGKDKLDNLMSQVIDFDEKEKEETILFLVEALISENSEFLKHISPKVQNIVLPFLISVAIKGQEERIKEGGEKDGTGKKR